MAQAEFADRIVGEIGPEAFLKRFKGAFYTNFAGEVTFPRYFLPTE